MIAVWPLVDEASNPLVDEADNPFIVEAAMSLQKTGMFASMYFYPDYLSVRYFRVAVPTAADPPPIAKTARKRLGFGFGE